MILKQAGKSGFGGQQIVRQREAALAALDPLVDAGLERRRGSFIEPTFGGFKDGSPIHSVERWIGGQVLVACTPAFHDDQWLWWWVETVVACLGDRRIRRRLRVCEGCSIVFAPSRKTRAAVRYCRLCAHKPPAAPLTARVLKELHDAPGITATIRVPSPIDGPIAAWSRRTIGLCSACGKPFVAHKGNAQTHQTCRAT